MTLEFPAVYSRQEHTGSNVGIESKVKVNFKSTSTVGMQWSYFPALIDLKNSCHLVNFSDPNIKPTMNCFCSFLAFHELNIHFCSESLWYYFLMSFTKFIQKALKVSNKSPIITSFFLMLSIIVNNNACT